LGVWSADWQRDGRSGSGLGYHELLFPVAQGEEVLGAAGKYNDLLQITEERALTMSQDILEKLYREGASFISILDPEVLKEAEKWRNLSFLERKDMFVDLFRSFKARVDTVMRGPCLEECVLIIGKLSKQSATNRVNNDNKQYDLKEGRKRSDRKTGKAKKKG
jgi:hypothetical protein